jgi:DNA-binding GntR family transcriptional regulator
MPPPCPKDICPIMPTLGRRAYEKLRDMLVSGRLQPGMQLVNRKLADEIGMSMTPVREAVTRLASEGLVEYVPGAGAFVRRISRQELAQLYDVRRALESLAAKEAAEHATAADITELRAIAADSFTIIRAIAESADGHATPEQLARWVDDEQRFHTQLFRAARNPWLSKLATDLKLLALGFSPQRRIPSFLTVPAAVSTWREHRRLVRALATRNAALAAATIDDHIAAGKREVFSHLAADGGLRHTDLSEGEPRAARRPQAARVVSRPAARRVSTKTARPGGRRRSPG